MATSTPGLRLFNMSMWAQNPLNTITISTPGTNKAGAIYVAPKTGNIRYVGFVLTGTSVSGTLEVRVETVNSSRVPSGTLQGTNTNNATVTSPTVNTFTWFQLTADAAVTAGDAVAAVVAWVVTANNVIGYSLNRSVSASPYALSNTGSWTAAQQLPTICLKYDDGTIITGGVPCSTLVTNGFKSGTNPNERATVFTPPFDCTLSGAEIAGYCDNAATTFTLNLYTGTSTSATATALFPANVSPSLFNENIITANFASSVSLSANTQYRLSVLATNASNNFNTFAFTWPSTAERNATVGAATSDTRNGGAWIGETTTRTEMICPVFDTITTSGGGSPLVGAFQRTGNIGTY